MILLNDITVQIQQVFDAFNGTHELLYHQMINWCAKMTKSGAETATHVYVPWVLVVS